MNGQRCARGAAIWVLALVCAASSGCVTLAEFRKLESQVQDLKRGPEGASSQRARLADLAAEMTEIEAELQRLEGRLEVNERAVDEARSEARAARMEAANPGFGAVPPPGDAPAGADGSRVPGSLPAEAGPPSAEIEAYRTAYSAWRNDDAPACIDRFRDFLQTYPSSAYADDSAYWMADCFFMQGDFKTAILRFDDVVARYPTGNKAADALYRQGEALLRLGPGYGKAASKAFERVLREYPDSARAPEAKRQLDLLRAG